MTLTPAMESALPAMSALWSVPFAGLLLSIAVLPLLWPRLWHGHSGKIVMAWALAFLLPFAARHGAGNAFALFAHAFIDEYLPFIILIGALYTIAGGIYVRGNLHGSPRTNVALLALGCALASVMGTTGAAMLLIRPVLRANDNRRHATHMVVFFIFLVANAGGMLTPLGDPPLFLGFLNGVSFFWTARHLALPMLFVCGVLLALFYLLDSWYFRREDEARPAASDPTPDNFAFGLDGQWNLLLIAAAIGLVLISGLWKPPAALVFLGVPLGWQNLVRDVGLVALTGLSLILTPRRVRERNHFHWEPIIEVARIFAGIFITIAPVIMILRAGEAGAFAGIAQWVNDAAGQPDNARYFWGTGILSSFLDNAPTYLVFFNLAGGHAPTLMTTGANTLAAISAGAVLMGANTYIGNAPNLMVKSIAQARGVKMPGFFGYIAWSGAVLLPVFVVTTWIFFR